VNVLRNSFTTEYGQGQAVVSIVTKSGSNQSAGSAYDYVRNENTESANCFGQKPGDRTQAGATIGGPLMRDRFFFFGGYEGLRSTAGPISRARVEFRAEIFNLLNHDNFGTPDANISNATAGVISTADDGRATQFGLRFAW
jgi:hypothetical protein